MQPVRSLGYRRLLFYILAGILFVYGLLGFVVVPLVAEKKLPEIAASAINGQIRVRDIDFNPFFFSASITGLTVSGPSGESLLYAEHAAANVELSSVLKRGPVLKLVEIQGAQIHLSRDENGTWNFNELIAPGESDTDSGKKAVEEKSAGADRAVFFSVRKIRITDAQIRYHDKASGFKTHADKINLEVNRLSSRTGAKADFQLDARTRADENLACSGKIGLFPLTASARIQAENVDIPKYAPFYRENTGLEIRSGKIDVSAKIHWPQPKPEPGSEDLVSEGQIVIRSLVAADPHTGNAVIDIPEFMIPDIGIDLAGKSLSARGVFTRGGKILCERTREGGINLSRITAGASAAGAEDSGAEGKKESEVSGNKAAVNKTSPWNFRIGTISVSDYTVTYSDLVPEEPVSMEIRGMNVRLYNFSMQEDSRSHWSINSLTENGAISAQGHIGIAPLKAEINFKATDIGMNTAAPYAAGYGMNIQEGFLNVAGTIQAEATRRGFAGSYAGELWIDDLAVTGIQAGPFDVDIREGNLDINSRITGETTPDGFSASYSGDFKIDNLGLDGIDSEALGIDVEKGSFSIGGMIDAQATPDGFSGSYGGNLDIDDFVLDDLKSGKPFLRFAHLGLEEIRAGFDPPGVRVRRLIIGSPKITVIRDEQGNLIPALLAGNNQEDVSGKKPDKPAPKQNEAQAGSPPVDFAIETIQFEDGSFSFADQSIEPAFSGSLEAVDARVSGFSLNPGDVAPFEITGKLENQAPLNLKGELRTMQPLARTRLNVSFTNIGMPLFTPYAGKYAGYRIQKGKLNLNLDYSIDGRKLDAQNQLMLDQFYLGERVQSPDAMNLPLKFALALLRDRSGQIKLNVPVQGDMSSPEFRLGSVIFTTFVNLLKKAAASPFDLLASMIPGAEELSYVAFEPGQAGLDDQAEKKLAGLEAALYERPGLRLLIRPAADPEKDRNALLRQELEAACREAGIETEDMSIAEMQEALGKTMEIPDARLLELARKRGDEVRNTLLAKERIEAERVYLENPEIRSKTRVGFELQTR